MAGTLLWKDYKNRTIVVRVLDHGFEYDRRRFTSLSAIAQEITGTKWNGYLFFGLAKENRIAR
jgi:tRNA splicing ligase